MDIHLAIYVRNFWWKSPFKWCCVVFAKFFLACRVHFEICQLNHLILSNSFLPQILYCCPFHVRPLPSTFHRKFFGYAILWRQNKSRESWELKSSHKFSGKNDRFGGLIVHKPQLVQLPYSCVTGARDKPAVNHPISSFKVGSNFQFLLILRRWHLTLALWSMSVFAIAVKKVKITYLWTIPFRPLSPIINTHGQLSHHGANTNSIEEEARLSKVTYRKNFVNNAHPSCSL